MKSILSIWNWATGSVPDITEESEPTLTPQQIVRRKLSARYGSALYEDFVSRSTGIAKKELPFALGTVEGVMNSFFNVSDQEFQDELGQSIIFLKQTKVYMKVRLLLVETGIWRFMPELVNGIARTYTGNETPLGLVHAGLQIGPYYVDWTSYDLVVPHKLKSNSPILLAEINDENESSVEMNKENILKICQKIVAWNTTKNYSRSSDNCQKFALEVIEALGLPTKLGGSLGTFLDKLSEKGTLNMEFYDRETKTSTTFTTHAQLDNFIHGKSKDIGLERWKQEHLDDWKLLKGFDRAFWLKISFLDSDKWPEEGKPSAHGCPFNNPGLSAKRLQPVLMKESPHYIDLESVSQRTNSLKSSIGKLSTKEDLQYWQEEKERIEGALAQLADSLTEKDFEVIEKLKSSLTDIEKSVVLLGEKN